MGRDAISSQEISEYTHINATQIRRDLSGFGKFGKRGVGYNVDALIAEIRKILRTSGPAQHRARRRRPPGPGASPAPTSSPTTASTSPRSSTPTRRRSGDALGDVDVCALDDLDRVVRDKNIIVGVLAVPAPAAQEVADRLVASGMRIIFNYSGALLSAPPDVTVHSTSPAVELLYALYFYLA